MRACLIQSLPAVADGQTVGKHLLRIRGGIFEG